MALDKTSLTSALKTIFEATSPEMTPEEKANAVSTAIDTFVKSGTVNVTVATTGTPAAQTGTGTGSVS